MIYHGSPMLTSDKMDGMFPPACKGGLVRHATWCAGAHFQSYHQWGWRCEGFDEELMYDAVRKQLLFQTYYCILVPCLLFVFNDVSSSFSHICLVLLMTIDDTYVFRGFEPRIRFVSSCLAQHGGLGRGKAVMPRRRAVADRPLLVDTYNNLYLPSGND